MKQVFKLVSRNHWTSEEFYLHPSYINRSPFFWVARPSLKQVWYFSALWPPCEQTLSHFSPIRYLWNAYPKQDLYFCPSVDVILTPALIEHFEALVLQMQTAPATKAPPSGSENYGWPDVTSS